MPVTPDEPKPPDCPDEPKPPDWVELAKIAQQSFFNRRSLEWKLAFGFWTAIGFITAAFFKYADKIEFPGCFSWMLGCVYFILFLGAVFGWLIPIQTAHAGDKRWLIYYLNKAQNHNPKKPTRPEKLKPPKREDESRWNNNSYMWFFGQLIFTTVFLFLSWFLIVNVAKQSKKQTETRPKVTVDLKAVLPTTHANEKPTNNRN